MKFAPYIIGLFTSICLGCNAGGFSSKTNKADDDEGRRPSESGEGIPGYLTSPDLVSIEPDGEGRVAATGQPGAIDTGEGDITKVLVCLEVYPDGLDEGNTVDVIDKDFANADGSFSLSGTAAKDDPIGINVSGVCAGVVPKELAGLTKDKKTFIVSRNDEDIYFEDPGLFDEPEETTSENCTGNCKEETLAVNVSTTGNSDEVSLWIVEERFCSLKVFKLEEGSCDGDTGVLEINCGFGDTSVKVECALEQTFEDVAGVHCMVGCRSKAFISTEIAVSKDVEFSVSSARLQVIAEDNQFYGNLEVEPEKEEAVQFQLSKTIDY